MPDGEEPRPGSPAHRLAAITVDLRGALQEQAKLAEQVKTVEQVLRQLNDQRTAAHARVSTLQRELSDVSQELPEELITALYGR